MAAPGQGIVAPRILKHLGGNNGISSLGSSCLARRTSDEPDLLDVFVPVHQTLIVKSIIDEEEAGEVAIIGTIVQRTIGVDLPDWSTSEVEHFSYRVNERAGHADMDVRKSTLIPITSNGESVNVMGRATTISCKIPLERYVAIDADPFCIMAMVATLELTSVEGMAPSHNGSTENERRSITLRPDLWAHLVDPRNLVTVREGEAGIDRTRQYDPISASPAVEYISTTADGFVYVNKMKVTYFMEKHAFADFFQTLLPVIFCNVASALSIIFLEHSEGDECAIEFNDVLGQAANVGLTLIFILPRLVQRESFITSRFGFNDLFVLLVMASLILGLLPECIPGQNVVVLARVPLLPLPGFAQLPVTQFLSIALAWGSLTLPLFNFLQYRKVRYRILNSVAQGGTFEDGVQMQKHSFLGSPKVSNKDICFDDLAPFWAQAGGIHPKVKDRPWFKSWKVDDKRVSRGELLKATETRNSPIVFISVLLVFIFLSLIVAIKLQNLSTMRFGELHHHPTTLSSESELENQLHTMHPTDLTHDEADFLEMTIPGDEL